MTNIDQPDIRENDEWEVIVDKKPFILKGNEFAFLTRVIESGNRGIVGFKDFGVSVAHISSYRLLNREPIISNNQLPEHTRLTKEEREKTVKRLDKIRGMLKNNFINKTNT